MNGSRLCCLDANCNSRSTRRTSPSKFRVEIRSIHLPHARSMPSPPVCSFSPQNRSAKHPTPAIGAHSKSLNRSAATAFCSTSRFQSPPRARGRLLLQQLAVLSDAIFRSTSSSCCSKYRIVSRPNNSKSSMIAFCFKTACITQPQCSSNLVTL